MTGVPQGELTVARLCALSHLGRAGYYRHFRASAPRQEETSVRDAIQCIALKNRFYGYRRIRAELRREGFLVNHKRIQRLIRQDNLLCLRKRPFVPVTTDSQHGWPVVPNLARSMVLTGLDQLWVADITYVRMLEKFAYLAILLDAFSRRVIGWALETHLQASLAIAALKMALDARQHGCEMGVPDASRTRRRLLSWGSATLAMAFGTLTMPLCPAHHLPLDRRHLWGPLADAFMCRECESLYQARLAARVPLIPDIPANATNAEAMQILCDMMPAGGDGWGEAPCQISDVLSEC